VKDSDRQKASASTVLSLAQLLEKHFPAEFKSKSGTTDRHPASSKPIHPDR